MKRWDIINIFIDRFKYQSYLEIGVKCGENYNKINCPAKVGIDPDPFSVADIKVTSDNYFQNSDSYFDLIFIDGLHHQDQLYKDIINSCKHLRYKGAILCHDILPENEDMQKVPRITKEWTGDCWKAFAKFRHNYKQMQTFTIDLDYGIGVVFPTWRLHDLNNFYHKIDIKTKFNWNFYQKHYKSLLNVIAPNKLKSALGLTKQHED